MSGTLGDDSVGSNFGEILTVTEKLSHRYPPSLRGRTEVTSTLRLLKLCEMKNSLSDKQRDFFVKAASVFTGACAMPAGRRVVSMTFVATEWRSLGKGPSLRGRVVERVDSQTGENAS